MGFKVVCSWPSAGCRGFGAASFAVRLDILESVPDFIGFRKEARNNL